VLLLLLLQQQHWTLVQCPLVLLAACRALGRTRSCCLKARHLLQLVPSAAAAGLLAAFVCQHLYLLLLLL
jgi:hypothetical protein